MDYSKKTYLYTTPRHYRFMFFIDSNIGKDKIIKLFHSNLQIWGGRYNPIVPVFENNFESYKDLIGRFDPDYIYYTSNIDIDLIKKLNCFNPREYIFLDDNLNFLNFGGKVNYHYILNDSVRDYLYHSQFLNLLQIEIPVNTEIPNQEFYETNFGLFSLFGGQSILMRGYNIIKVDENNAKEINRIIADNKPFFKSILSQLYANTTICNPKDYGVNHDFEMVVYDEKNPILDLTYFWNRQLYITSDSRLYQIIISKSEFNLLIDDLFFHTILRDLSSNNSSIELVSKSIPRNELEVMKDSIQNNSKFTRFKLSNDINFPFEIEESVFRNNLSNKVKCAIIGQSDLLVLPKLNFGNRTNIEGGYVIDIEIEKEEQNATMIKFPRNSSFQTLFCKNEGRVNFNNNVSIFVTDKTLAVDVSVPSSGAFFLSILSNHLVEGKYFGTGVTNLKLSPDGQKLAAFLKIFNDDWNSVSEFIEDKFWLQIFKCAPIIKRNGIRQGIFSYKDVMVELSNIYNKFKEKMLAEVSSDSLNLSKNDFRKLAKRYKYEARADYIDFGLQYLIENGGIFLGMKVKCENCGSNKWYSLGDISNKMQCNGCNYLLIPSFNSKLYYKLSEIIIGNIINDQNKGIENKTEKHFHGNYIVLKTLLWLKNESRNCFIYHPQLKYDAYYEGVKIHSSDIDIVVVQDGFLILGEAKNDSKEFNSEKEINNLIWIANNVKPSKIVLAFNNGPIPTKSIDKICAGIEVDIKCDVIPYQVSSSWYKFRGIFGQPH